MAKRVDHEAQQVVDDVDYGAFPEIVTDQGEVLSAEQVAFAYSREGRRVVGKEYPSPIPLEPPLGYQPHIPLHEQIRAMVQRELSQVADREGFETMEESDDFDVQDDYDPSTPYEELFEPTAPWPPRPEVEAAERAVEAAKVSEGGGGAEPPSDKPPGPGGPPSDKPLP